MLDIIMDIDNSVLRALNQILQTLRLKDIPGENIHTTVRHFKGVLMLLQNCSGLPTDTMGLLSNIVVLVDCKESSGFTNLV